MGASYNDILLAKTEQRAHFCLMGRASALGAASCNDILLAKTELRALY
jgi:hypothetical protein